jgi:hypothetical protein
MSKKSLFFDMFHFAVCASQTSKATRFCNGYDHEIFFGNKTAERVSNNPTVRFCATAVSYSESGPRG